MQAALLPSWPPRIAALVLGLLLFGSAVFWVLRWPSTEAGRALPASVGQEPAAVLDAAALSRLLGGDIAAVAAPGVTDASSRFRLAGVIASGGGQGVALVSVDGKPAKPYRVGSFLEDGWMLQSVEPRSVALAPDASAPVRMRLELPARAR